MCSRYSVRPSVSVGRGTTVYGSEARNSATSLSYPRYVATPGHIPH
jgi:hypothetical protein